MVNLSELTKNSKNSELSECKEFRDKLREGKPLIYFIDEAKAGSDGKLYLQVFIAQLSKYQTKTKGLLESDGLFLGYSGDFERCIRNIDYEIFKANKGVQEMMQVGKLVQGMNIEIQDSMYPFYEGQSPRLKKNRLTGNLDILCLDNEPIFRQTSLVFGDTNSTIIEFNSKTENVYPDVAENELQQLLKGKTVE
jgi:hypothetical protein